MTHKEEFIKICEEKIHRDGINDLLEWLCDSDFFTAPASTRFHGNYDGGLCEHSINVYKQLVILNGIYQTNISEETLAIVGLFHDLCKVNFYVEAYKSVKDSETQKWTTKRVWEINEKVPLGHGEKSCLLLQWYMKLSITELLAIRWHMGGFDSAVKGGDRGLNNAQDMSPLVTLLHAADLLSSNLLEVTKE